MIFGFRGKKTGAGEKNVAESKQIVSQGGKGEDSYLLYRNEKITIDKLEKRIEESGFASENLINNIKYINENVENQIKYIESVVGQIDNYSAIAEEVSASTLNSQRIAENTMIVAKSGSTAIRDSIESMKHIEESVEHTKKMINSLSVHAGKIDEMLNIIRDISRQTNILSLNAAIEAARAGQYGKGFAVVADEVRKLAVKSNDSAEQISLLVSTINDSIGGTIKSIDQSVLKVNEGMETVANTNSVFNEIISSVDMATSVTNEINKAMEEQINSLQNLISSTDGLNNASQKIMSISEIMFMNAQQTKTSIDLLIPAIKLLKTICSNIESKRETEKQSEKIYRIRTTISEQFKSQLDPASAYFAESINMLANLHAGLLIRGTSTNILPGIAKSWYVKDDNLTWVFNLRRGAKFHNGREITSKDVKYSFERLLSPKLKAPNAWFLYDIEGAEEFNQGKTSTVSGINVLDDYRIELKLSNPYSGFLYNLAQPGCSILDMKDIEKGKFTGCGAYMLTEDDGEKYTFTAYKDYFGGHPYADAVEVYYSSKSKLDDFLNKKLDFITINNAQAKELNMNSSEYTVAKQEIMQSLYWGFNLKRNSVFSRDKDIRLAICHAIDKKKIINDIFNGMAVEGRGIFPPAMLNDNKFVGYEYNPAKSKEILERKGYYKTGEELLVLAYDNVLEPTGQYIVESLEKVGIKCKIVSAPAKDYLLPSAIAKSDIFSLGWVADTADPHNFLYPQIHPNGSTNLSGYINDKVTKMLDKAKKEVNPQERIDLYKEIQRQVGFDVPIIPLYYPISLYVYNKFVDNVSLSSLNQFRYEDILIRKED